MHMADALISPAVGGTMWTVSAGMLVYCANRIKKDLDEKMVPLMGVLGAFVFAAQMINFTIPATGSSGHLGGGLLLAILLGPSAAFLTIASILTVQALFFADGGLLALGCNMFNMGVIPCLLVYTLVYRPIAGNNPTPFRIFTGSLLAAVVSLQLGALGVVFQTLLSGITDLSMQTFLLFMLPIHLAIGLVEGLATASIILFIRNARPEILHTGKPSFDITKNSLRKPIMLFLGSALITGCVVSLYASGLPDGLEWSLFKTTGAEELAVPANSIHEAAADIQEKTAFLPDYGFKQPDVGDTGTSVSGFIGSMIILLFASLLGFLLKRRKTEVSHF